MTVKPTYEKLEKRVQQLEKIKSERNQGKDLVQDGQYRWLVENANELILVAQDGLIRFVNQKAFDYLGYSPEELTDTPFIQYIYPEDREKVSERHLKRLKGENLPGVYPFRVVDRNGKARWMEVNAVLSEWNGKPATLNYINDITERKRAEGQLRLQSLVLNQIQDCVTVTDLDGVITYVNDAEARSLGYSQEELIGEPTDKFGEDPEQGATQQEIVAKTLEHGKWRGEVVNRTADGRRVIMDCRTQVVLDESGNKFALAGISTDITERLRMEQALRDSELMYRTTFDAIPSSITVTRQKDGRYKYVNDGFCNITGYSRLEVIGKTPIEINLYVNHSDRERLIQTLRKNRELLNFEIPFRRKNGTIWDSFFSARSIIIDGEDCLIALTKNVTEFKKAEEEKAKLERQLHQAQKMESLGSLAGGIAHDFNNLLFPIIGLSEMMLEDFPLGSPEHHDVQQICKAGNRGRELVQQILSFSQQSDYQLIPVHIQKILKEVLKLCRATIPTDIKIKQDLQTDCNLVMADPTQIHQIAMNLITNAFHAVEPTGGTIKVELKEIDFIHEDDPDVQLASGRYAVLSVIDTGTGIDPAVMNRIFDPYFTTKEKGRGTGLGLATVHGIVKNHGGDIRVHSEIGKGSSFHVYLPVLEKSAAAVPEKQQQPLPTGTEHIMVVDDEAPIAHMEKKILERLGYRITSFTSSVDALAEFKAEPSCFDLILTDMNMPNTNGMQLAEKLIAVRPDIPVIICTGFSERINSKKADVMGIRGLLMKPLRMKDLAQKVREVLDTMKE